jgi:hypothetical protein
MGYRIPLLRPEARAMRTQTAIGVLLLLLVIVIGAGWQVSKVLR